MMSSAGQSCDFDKVDLGTFLESPCSPRFPTPKAVGVLIRMPDRISVPSTGAGRWPVCITAQLTGAEIERYPHVFQPVHVVIVDDERGETVSGSLWKDRTFRSPEPLSMTDEEKKTITIASYYNVNVLERIDLPRRNGRYHVYVTLNAHKSNVCTIEVSVK